MNKSEYQEDILGIVAFIKITIKASKGYGQMSSNCTYFSDIWFNRIKHQMRQANKDSILAGQ